ncbi:NAD(+)/NADH kinase [Marispirochaeta sp.]|uniref:NAD(+)/NADH kinase n=1 Tax=Marispirochaeta sp. TaxID=2038653 RepID=UPI0029C6B3E9|nr:NAD(+)/NADH kinase [Marispirochaeta sp.]
MQREVKYALLVANCLKEKAESLISDIGSYLQEQKIFYTVNRITGKPDISSFSNKNPVDLVFSLGGDGTVLYTARALAGLNVPILAVNIGSLGFITEVTREEWKEAFEKYRSGLLGLSERVLVQVSVERNGRIIRSFEGFNDAVVASDGISKVIRLSVEISDTPVGKYRADGIIVSSPTGSTAYSAAAGGPILDPEMEALVLNPICPFTLSNRTIVVNGDRCITILVERDQRAKVILTIDGQIVFPLEPEDKLHIRRSPRKVSLIRSDRRNFYEVLRTKLNWSGGPDA